MGKEHQEILVCNEADMSEPELKPLANEAILSLVDFPKQIVVALSTAIDHMKGKAPPFGSCSFQTSVSRTLSGIAQRLPR
jgi:hypothetical protein